MLKSLQNFIANPKPSRQEALGVLRANFALMFLAQVLVAILLAVLLRLLSKPQHGSVLVSQILVLFTLLQLPLGVSLPLFASRHGGKGAALSATLLMSVLLSTSAWFAAFAFLIGSQNSYLMIMLLLLIIYYNTGFFLCGHFANVALKEPPEKANGSDETEQLAQNSTDIPS
ncbi:MAG: hypothetical protein KC422_18235 [Trueperaceae bacterium]|nr:hypothetical protein [Trueperaceae bacterium]